MRAFADTNVVIYALGANEDRTARAVAILEAGPVISSQVINETVSVLTRKHGFTLTDAHKAATYLLDICEVMPVDDATIRESIRLAGRYQLSHWDSLIAAAALLAGCDTLLSEDFQHGQVLDDRLAVLNPFAVEPARP